MRKTFFLFIFSIGVIFTTPSLMAAATPSHLLQARHLLEKTMPEFTPLFQETDLHLTKTKSDALAKYMPSMARYKKPTIQFRSDLRQYKDDFVMVSSTIDRAYRPTFDHYMVVLSALSLSNEWAHFAQDKNGSLTDWYNLKLKKDSVSACALYSLQQYVSDIVMMETAYKLDVYFRKNNDLKGSLSIQMALEKMLLNNIFWDYTIARTTDNNDYIAPLLMEMYRIRYKANMGGIKNCPKEPIAHTLDKKIFDRAIAPVPLYLKPLIQSHPNL